VTCTAQHPYSSCSVQTLASLTGSL
jgi:hypothetical protein